MERCMIISSLKNFDETLLNMLTLLKVFLVSRNPDLQTMNVIKNVLIIYYVIIIKNFSRGIYCGIYTIYSPSIQCIRVRKGLGWGYISNNILH